MAVFGIWVNALTVIVGGVVGTLLRGGISERFRLTIGQGLALCVLLIGVSGAIATQNVLLVIVSVVLGGLCGEALKIEDRLETLGGWAQKRFSGGDSSFSQGFVSATLLFCVGSMAVVGSFEAGLSNKPDTLLAKSMLDGVSSIIFASTLGPGVILSALPLTLYQGSIALVSRAAGSFLSEAAIREMSATGSVLIIGLSLNMLGFADKRIRVGNLLPAILIPALYLLLRGA